MESCAERFDVSTGARIRFTPQAVTLQDEGQWPGIRPERSEGKAQDLGESVLFQHVLALCQDAQLSSEVRWSGHRCVSTTLSAGSIVILPAGLPYRCQSKGYWPAAWKLQAETHRGVRAGSTCRADVAGRPGRVHTNGRVLICSMVQECVRDAAAPIHREDPHQSSQNLAENAICSIGGNCAAVRLLQPKPLYERVSPPRGDSSKGLQGADMIGDANLYPNRLSSSSHNATIPDGWLATRHASGQGCVELHLLRQENSLYFLSFNPSGA